jgi:hypothetical protein
MGPPPDDCLPTAPPPEGGLLAVPPPGGNLLAVPPPGGDLLTAPPPGGGLLAVPPPGGDPLTAPPPGGGLLTAPPAEGYPPSAGPHPPLAFPPMRFSGQGPPAGYTKCSTTPFPPAGPPAATKTGYFSFSRSGSVRTQPSRPGARAPGSALSGCPVFWFRIPCQAYLSGLRSSDVLFNQLISKFLDLAYWDREVPSFIPSIRPISTCVYPSTA